MTTDALPVTGVCELVLEQGDLAAAEHFYADVLGFPVVERWHRNGEAVWVMAGDRTRIGFGSHKSASAGAVAASMSTTRWGYLLKPMKR